MNIKILCLFLVLILLIRFSAFSQQVVDSLFTIDVKEPAYQLIDSPLIILDEAHNNGSKLSTSFKPTSKILVKDGYTVKSNSEQISTHLLKRVDILVIIDALAIENVDHWKLPNPSAFSESEIETIHTWVEKGGSLLLVADHMPFAGASKKLAAAFGVKFFNGFAIDTVGWDLTKFNRDENTLQNHPVTEGKNADEQVNEISTYFGQCFTTSNNGLEPIMVFNDENIVNYSPMVAWRFNRNTDTFAAKGYFQGIIGAYGNGRLAVLGDSSIILAHIIGENERQIGINSIETKDNLQFTLNLFHWLSHLF